ncbi:MAG: hypothetical protein JO353_13845 [Phycisphaerae bacterium]|nr:hypothetical protein [Phycisphaerae bacterium]
MSQTPCPKCGQLLPTDAALVCPACGALVHAHQLEQLAAEAKWQERFSARRAVVLWEQCLQLLPKDSGQYAAIQKEIDRLLAMPQEHVTEEPGGIPPIRNETLTGGLWKTGLSMAISIIIYGFAWNWPTAIGFTLLIFVHELGHVVANLYYGVPASAPIFIPFLGAVINLRRPPPNAKIEAICAIAGPIAGTIGALACFGWYFYDHSAAALELAWFGFTINLFNLLPVPPLDGGRVAAAISPWIWILGLIGMGGMIVAELRDRREPGILLLILFVALPRIIRTLKPKGRSGPYYAIGKLAPAMVGVIYLLLLACLIGLRWYAQVHLPDRPLM